MSKRFYVFCVVVFFVSNCAAPKRVRTNKDLFYEIDKTYPFSEYNLVLKTNDGVFYLSDPKIVNGQLKAGMNGSPAKGKKLVITAKVPSKKILLQVIDSNLGGQSNYVLLSNEQISKVKVHGKFSGFDRRVVYDRYWTLKRILLILALLLALAGFIYIIYQVVLAAIALGGLIGEFCYIATMVYKSYDAPEVRVLRKFRDEKLATNFFGRIFIKVYYALSPFFVRLFKNNKTVNKFCKTILDWWVSKLMKKEKTFFVPVKI